MNREKNHILLHEMIEKLNEQNKMKKRIEFNKAFECINE